MRSFVQGSFQSMKGDYWGAIETFRKITTTSPSEAAAVEYSISKAFFSLSVPDSARVHGERAVRLDPQNYHYARHLARVAHDMQDFGRAAELYGQAAAAAPERTEILYSQALEYVAANRPSEALDVFSKILDRDHLDEKALSQTLWLQIALKRYPEAIDTLNHLAAASGNDMKLRLTLGQLYDLSGNGAMAVQTFREIITEDRSAVPAWVALFDQRIRMGNEADLLREYRDFENITPVDVGRSVEVARIFVSRSEHDSLYVKPSSMMLSELVSRHPGDSMVYQLRGVFEMTRRKYGEAAASFGKAVSLAPGEVSGWERMVMAGLELKDKRMVFRTISRAKLALPRQHLRLSVLEGYALLHTGSPAKAARILETVAGRKKGSLDDALLIQANTSLAMAYDQMGKRRRSGVVYARVLELDPHNSLAMNNLAYLYAEQGVMLQQALRYARNAVLLEPENGVFLDTLGWVQYLLGSYDDAREMLEKAVASGIEEEEVYRHLGKAYEKLGQADKAREMFDKARGVKAKPSVP
jgi:tetratricopeptide (TPR) repeat protein